MSSPKLPTVDAYEAHEIALTQLDRLMRKVNRYATVAYQSMRGEEETLRELRDMRALQDQIMAVLHGQLEGWVTSAKAMNRRGDNNALRQTLVTKIGELTELLRQLDDIDNDAPNGRPIPLNDHRAS